MAIAVVARRHAVLEAGVDRQVGGVAGCAALEGTVLVNLVNSKKTVAVRLAPDTGAVTGDPEVVRENVRGHAWALQLSPDGNVWGATVNRTAGLG